MQIGYCTNVHAGADLETTQSNLTEHALRVKSKHAPDSPMGIGLWLSANAAQGLAGDTQLVAFKDWLAENGLLPFTMNGFPFGDFHQEVDAHNNITVRYYVQVNSLRLKSNVYNFEMGK